MQRGLVILSVQTVSWLRLVLPISLARSFRALCQLLAQSQGKNMMQSSLTASDLSFQRSRINGDVGGRTQMASIVCSGIILLAIFFLLPWLYYLPKCVLAAMYVFPQDESTSILTYSPQHRSRRVFFARGDASRRPLLLAVSSHCVFYFCNLIMVIHSMSAWVDITIMSLTFFLSIIYNIEIGVVVSLVISLLLVVHRSSKTRMTILVRYCLFYFLVFSY